MLSMLMSMQRILSCTPPPTANVTGTFCVHASPNPEFANSPSNFAHWFFAHVYPMVAALTATGVPAMQIFRARILIGHGNNRVFPRWSTHYRELLGGGICHGGRAAQWPAACTAEVRIATPIFSFRNRSFYPTLPWRAFAHALRLSPMLMGHVHAEPRTRIVVLLREPGSDARQIHGLERACELSSVTCLWPTRRMPLGHAGAALSDAGALLAGHGAALAFLPFLSSGAKFFELDSILNAARSRNMYQYLAFALGIDALKVWLDSNSTRYCPGRTIACTSAAGGTTVHGCAVGYRANMSCSWALMSSLLRDAAASPNSTQLTLARDCSGIRGDDYRGKGWWKLREEMNRVFPSQ